MSKTTRDSDADQRHEAGGAWRGIWRGWIKPIAVVIILLSTFRSSVADWNDVPSGSMLPTIHVGDRIVVNKLAYGFSLPFTGPKIGIPFTEYQWSNPLRADPLITWNKPLRGDIITFWSPARKHGDEEPDGTRLVKRVVAVAGDTVEWTADGRLIITTRDGDVLEAQYSDKQFGGVTFVSETGQPQKADMLQFTEEIDGSARTIYLWRDRMILRPFPGPHTWAEQGPYVVPEGHVWAMGDNRDFSGDSRRAVMGPIPIENITGRVFGVAFAYELSPFEIYWNRTARPLN